MTAGEVTKTGQALLNLSAMTVPLPLRRIAPQTGAHLWTGAALSPADWMLPVGAEIAAELAAPTDAGAPLARLDPLLAQLAERTAHGLGFGLLRGLKLPEEPAALLGLLGGRLGRAVAASAAPGDHYNEPCDILLLLCREAVEMTLLSAAALHNEVMKADRAALEALYRAQPEGPGPALPVFAVTGGVFAARCDRQALSPEDCGPALAALDRAAEAPGLALRLTLHPGDVLGLNPFLVWATRRPQLAALALVTENSRLPEAFAAAADGS